MGRSTGVCAGRGGSQHLYWGNFYSNGVQGGIVPIATGMALAEKRKASGAVVVSKAAVRQDGGRAVVFVVRDGRAERRTLTTSGTLDQEVTITTGVAAGERVVVEGPTTLADGTRVREKKS